jgi:hypothetical protein
VAEVLRAINTGLLGKRYRLNIKVSAEELKPEPHPGEIDRAEDPQARGCRPSQRHATVPRSRNGSAANAVGSKSSLAVARGPMTPAGFCSGAYRLRISKYNVLLSFRYFAPILDGDSSGGSSSHSPLEFCRQTEVTPEGLSRI